MTSKIGLDGHYFYCLEQHKLYFAPANASSFKTQPFGSTVALLANLTVAEPLSILIRWILPSTSTSTGIGNSMLFGVSQRIVKTFAFVSVTSLGSFGCRR